MIINAKKINILEGAWVTNDYHELVAPQFTDVGISSFRYQILPITRLHDNEYWWELRSTHQIDIAVPDHRHWYFPDDVFAEFVERLISVRFPIFSIFEAPFGFEMPKVDPEVFEQKLFERCLKLSTAIKDKHPDTIILSPAIYAIDEQYRVRYLDFFIHNRGLFDGYSVHCCNDMSEHSLGKMSSFLNQIMDILPKRLWITKWAVPCFDGKIVNPQIMGPAGWEPYDSRSAVQRLQRSFSIVESIATLGSHWFYIGTCRDFYKPRKVPGPQEYWENVSPIIPEEYSYGWKYWHFLGLLDSDGQPKNKLIASLIRLASQYNG